MTWDLTLETLITFLTIENKNINNYIVTFEYRVMFLKDGFPNSHKINVLFKLVKSDWGGDWMIKMWVQKLQRLFCCRERNNGLWNYKTFTHTGFAAVINFWANSISGKLLSTSKQTHQEINLSQNRALSVRYLKRKTDFVEIPLVFRFKMWYHHCISILYLCYSIKIYIK